MTLEKLYVKENNIMTYDFYLDDKMMDKLLDEKKYNLIISYIIDQYDTGGYNKELFPKLETALIENNDKNLLRKFWNHIISKKSDRFWYLYKHYNEYNHNKPLSGFMKFFKKKEPVIDDKKITTEELLAFDKILVEENHVKYPSKQNTKLNLIWDWYEILGLIDTSIEQLEKMDLIGDVKKLIQLKENIYNLKKPKAKKTTDKRKMSEDLFWELIEESGKASDNDSEFIDTLKDKLEAMNAPEIKKFQKILLEQINELEHWDIWALAYIIRKGCGDDAFDYFKAWVISKGKEAFENVKNMKIEKLKNLFQNNDPQFEEFMYVAQEAYENKKNEMMPDIRIKAQKIQGQEWTEDKICESYPELCKMFNYS